MVSPGHRRAVVRWAETAFQLSERRACRVFGVSRRLIWYRSRRPDDAVLRRRLHELAAARVAFGSRRLHILLRRDGLRVNYKKVHRLYVEEALQLKPRRRRRRRAVVARMHRPPIAGANQRWAMDFMHDTLATGTKVRVFTLIDVWRRECLALRIAPRFSGNDVAAILAEVGDGRALPAVIQCDNGTEFTSTALDHWAYWNKVQLDFSRPGKPVDNSVCEAFNGTLRRECLSQHWFASLIDAFAAATSPSIRRSLEEKVKAVDDEIVTATETSLDMSVAEDDLDDFLAHVRKVLEHPANILDFIREKAEQLALYRLFFEVFPTYEEIVTGTAKLTPTFVLFESSASSKSNVVGDTSHNWNTISHEMARWKEAYWAIDLAFERMKESESGSADPDSIPQVGALTTGIQAGTRRPSGWTL